MLTACGGLPHPGAEAVRQAAGRLETEYANYDGTSNANEEGARKKESKEAFAHAHPQAQAQAEEDDGGSLDPPRAAPVGRRALGGW